MIFGKNGYVGQILPLPEPGFEWVLSKTSTNAESFEYVLYTDSFRVGFRFPESLGEPADHYVVVSGFRDKTGQAYLGGEADILGFAKIRPK